MKDYVYWNSVDGIATLLARISKEIWSVAKGVLTCTGQIGPWA